MEIRSSIILLLFTALVHADVPDTKPIKEYPLNERTVYTIPINRNQVTTIQFPSAVTALEVSGITVDPKVPAPVLLHYQPGRWFFSVRALTDPAAASLNVVWNKKTYVIQFITGAEPLRSVTFYQQAERDVAVKAEVGPTKLLSLLDLAKAYPLLRQQHSDQLPPVETAQPHQRMLYKDFEVEIDEVYRFAEENTLIFRLVFYNQSEREIYYQPQALAVRVGTQVYPCSLADASGVMPPGTRNPATGQIDPGVSLAFFTVTGAASGGSALAVNNHFNVLVSRQTSPVTLNRP